MMSRTQLQLRVLDGQFEHRHTVHPLGGEHYDIGRRLPDYQPESTEILYREPTLSRIHATLTWRNLRRGYELTHTSDVNPTLVNGKPIRKILLAPGDRIQMGLLILELEHISAASRSRGEQEQDRLERLEAIMKRTKAKYAQVRTESSLPHQG